MLELSLPLPHLLHDRNNDLRTFVFEELKMQSKHRPRIIHRPLMVLYSYLEVLDHLDCLR